MNGPSSASQSPLVALSEIPPVAFTPAEIDRSCRVPVLLLVASGLIWLLGGTALDVISSIKLHGPGFLSGYAWLTYGRVRPASTNLLILGFASQIGLATALWLLARLGRNLLQGSPIIIIGTCFWNLGLTIGIIGILAGDGTGYELLELPRYATPVLFVSYVMIGIAALLTFHERRERELYVSQWYVLAALLWFPWVYSTAQLLLIFSSVRGVLQEVVNGWAAQSLLSLWLTPLGLASLFYFLPKLANRPLYSRSLAIFGFWILAIFGSLGGLALAAPVPKWVSSVGVVGVVLSLTSVLGVLTNWHLTLTGAYSRFKQEVAARLILLGAACYLVLSLFQILGVLPFLADVTEFTLYWGGATELYLFGFVGLTLIGGLYYLVPRLAGADWPSDKLVRFHFWMAVLGALILALPLVIGGIVQGRSLNNASVNFLDVVRGTKPFLGTSTLGGVLLLAGTVAMLVNLGQLLCAGCCGFVSREAQPHPGRKRA